jgi:hypothetical protein
MEKVHHDERPRVREVEWAITGDLSRRPTTAAPSGSRVAVINEDLNIGIHPPPTIGPIIQTVGNQRVAASIWQTDYGHGQAGLVDPAYASTLYLRSRWRFLPRSCP